MTFDAPQVEPARTRRSNRTSPQPAVATEEKPGAADAKASRSQARRAAGDAAAVQDVPVWGNTARAEKLTDAAPALAAMAAVIEAATVRDTVAVREESPVAVVQPSDAPLTRRSRRAPSTEVPAPAVEPIVLHAEPVVDAEPIVVEAEPAVVDAEPFELLEPVETEPAAVEATDEPEAAASGTFFSDSAAADAFEAAARLFSFTGEVPVQTAAVTPEDEPAPAQAVHAVARGRRANRGASFKRVSATAFSIGVFGIVGLLTVGMTTPADAVAMVSGTSTPTTSLVAATAAGDVSSTKGEIQAYVAPADVQAAAIDRPESYSTVTMAQIAADSGILHFSDFFVNNPNSPIQWPFVVGVPISYGFGMRDGSMHEGVDFTPGEGAPIQAIADGVVRESTDAGGGYGVSIIIDHVIDGKLVSSHYAHMLYGSRKVEVGDHVKVGTIIGNTGNTGHSFGAHTHFEILANGTTPIDPIPWLREHAGG